jgi:ubiquitin-protein ligase
MSSLPRSTKRLLADFKNYIKNKPELTYISVCNNDIHNVKVLILGAKDTPYQYGNFFIDLKFTNDYPFNPPKGVFKTTNGSIRMNPNLYQDGKICLSILGTWSGPSWSIVQNLTSVVISIQSLLTEFPLRNEPGYEKCQEDEPKLINYNKYVEFHTINYSIVKMIQNKLYPPEFEYYIIKNFFDNYEAIYNIVDQNLKFDGEIASTTYLQLKVRLEYQKLQLELIELYKYADNYLKENKDTDFSQKIYTYKDNKGNEKSYKIL